MDSCISLVFELKNNRRGAKEKGSFLALPFAFPCTSLSYEKVTALLDISVQSSGLKVILFCSHQLAVSLNTNNHKGYSKQLVKCKSTDEVT